MKRYLELADEWNRGELQNRAPVQVEVYTQLRDLGYPKAWAGAPIEAMIHPDLLTRDYRELKKKMTPNVKDMQLAAAGANMNGGLNLMGLIGYLIPDKKKLSKKERKKRKLKEILDNY